MRHVEVATQCSLKEKYGKKRSRRLTHPKQKIYQLTGGGSDRYLMTKPEIIKTTSLNMTRVVRATEKIQISGTSYCIV